MQTPPRPSRSGGNKAAFSDIFRLILQEIPGSLCRKISDERPAHGPRYTSFRRLPVWPDHVNRHRPLAPGCGLPLPAMSKNQRPRTSPQPRLRAGPILSTAPQNGTCHHPPHVVDFAVHADRTCFGTARAKTCRSLRGHSMERPACISLATSFAMTKATVTTLPMAAPNLADMILK